ncbi:MAG TPA: HypC/HybG/HupF family hydrogenase formation chaperone [Acidimicrobiales bacterium]|nr:HypC/HybG/HupF family hydrogenase formation chaperone [Acidimicrobiales bacterium]
MSADAPSPLPDDLAVASLALARRFSAGATMWCAAPQWPAHGRHVAVEFVHPVIVGKRALPAVHVDSVDLVRVTRQLARPGDVLLTIGAADDDRLQALLRRADAWGLTSLWLGAGPRPAPGQADHVLWAEEAEPVTAARSGELVMLYHLLWELTHVVFEHPGLLEPPPACTDEVCITCSDEGRVAEVAAVGDGRCVEVVTAGHLETVDVSLVDRVAPGDLVLVHAGVAIGRIDEESRP